MIFETFLVKKNIDNYNSLSDDIKNNTDIYNEFMKTYFNFSDPLTWIRIIIMSIPIVLAGILSWRCNAKEHTVIRIINLLIAMLFSDIYILYYVIYRILLKNKCY